MADGDDTSRDRVRDFIEHQGQEFHPAFGVESPFDPFSPKPQAEEIRQVLTNLEETLKQYKNAAPDEVDFDVLNCTWKDVFAQLARAEAAGSESDHKGERFHRKAWRKLGESADIVSPGLAVLPDKLNVLQGGLAVVFSLARQRVKIRQQILHAFGDIPNVITMAYKKAENLPKDRPDSLGLFKSIVELQQTLLKHIPVLIALLNPRTFKERCFNTFKTTQIDDILVAVRQMSEKVRIHAEGLVDGIIVESYQSIQENGERTKKIHTITQHTDERTKTIHTITQKTDDGIGDLRLKIDDLMHQTRTYQAMLDAMASKDSLLGFLMEFLKSPVQSEGGDSPKMDTPPYDPYDATSVTMTAEQLFAEMNVRHLQSLDDEQRIIRRGHSIDPESISHAASMFQTKQIQHLLNSSQSAIVLVNGHGDRSQHGRISPLSQVCATLTDALRRSKRRDVILAFFCGQHTSSEDDLTGPQGLMRCLVAFLIFTLIQNNYITEETPVWISSFQGDSEPRSFRDLCDFFLRLIELVPPGVHVYCILDGISYYEKSRADFDLMMEYFDAIITSKTIGAVFKLLMTSPTVCHSLTHLQPHQKVSLRASRGGNVRDSRMMVQSAVRNLV